MGADPLWTTVAALGYLLAVITGPRLSITLLLVAPAALAAAAPAHAFTQLPGLAWVPVVILAVAPFFMHLGAKVPLTGAWVFLLITIALPLLALLHPAAGTLLAADLAPRLQVVIIATAMLAGLLLTTLLSALRPKGKIFHVVIDPETDHPVHPPTDPYTPAPSQDPTTDPART